MTRMLTDGNRTGYLQPQMMQMNADIPKTGQGLVWVRQVSFESDTDALRQVSVRIINLEIIAGSDRDSVRIDDEV